MVCESHASTVTCRFGTDHHRKRLGRLGALATIVFVASLSATSALAAEPPAGKRDHHALAPDSMTKHGAHGNNNRKPGAAGAAKAQPKTDTKAHPKAGAQPKADTKPKAKAGS